MLLSLSLLSLSPCLPSIRLPSFSVCVHTHNTTQYASAEMVPGVLVVRLDAPLYFANIQVGGVVWSLFGTMKLWGRWLAGLHACGDCRCALPTLLLICLNLFLSSSEKGDTRLCVFCSCSCALTHSLTHSLPVLPGLSVLLALPPLPPPPPHSPQNQSLQWMEDKLVEYEADALR